MAKENCAIIGCGRVGRALSIALKNAGYPISVIVDKNIKILKVIKGLFPGSLVTTEFKDWPDFDVLFFAVHDDDIEIISREFSESSIRIDQCTIVHTSGVLTSDVLSSLKKKGVNVASMHPVQTFVGTQHDTHKLRNSYFALEGDEEAINILSDIVSSIGGKSFVIPPEFKPYHHLACVLASNYIITLMNLAMSLFDPLKIPREKSKSILLPLMKNAVENMSHQGIASALTGPIVRGDIQTVREHINLLKKQDVNWLPLYVQLGVETVNVARLQPGTSKEKLDKIKALLLDVELSLN